MNEKLSITLPAELVAFIQEEVELGHYASSSDMLQHAVESLLNQSPQLSDAEIVKIGDRVRHSLADPRPSVPIEEAFERIDARVDELFKDR